MWNKLSPSIHPLTRLDPAQAQRPEPGVRGSERLRDWLTQTLLHPSTVWSPPHLAWLGPPQQDAAAGNRFRTWSSNWTSSSGRQGEGKQLKLKLEVQFVVFMWSKYLLMSGRLLHKPSSLFYRCRSIRKSSSLSTWQRNQPHDPLKFQIQRRRPCFHCQGCHT